MLLRDACQLCSLLLYPSCYGEEPKYKWVCVFPSWESRSWTESFRQVRTQLFYCVPFFFSFKYTTVPFFNQISLSLIITLAKICQICILHTRLYNTRLYNKHFYGTVYDLSAALKDIHFILHIKKVTLRIYIYNLPKFIQVIDVRVGI